MTVAAVSSPMARIAAIQARFNALPVAAAAPQTSTAVGSSTGSDFASLLAAASGSTSAGGATDLSGALVRVLGQLSGATGAAATDQAAGDKVVAAGQKYLGVPYRWGGTDPATGLDCSGFVQRVFGDLGVELPRVSRDQARQGQPVASIAEARPGDLVAFGEPVDHIAIYVGDNKIMHAPRTGEVVKITDIHRTPTAIRRIMAPTAATGAATGPGVTDPAAAGVTATGIAASSPQLVRYAHLFAQAGATHGIDPEVLAAVAKVESGGNPSAVSSAGASGLMQFMPGTARAMGIDPLDPAQAIDGAARLLVQQRNEFGSLELALAAYNAGGGAVRRAGGIPPYGQTQAYVAKVMGLLGGRT